MNWIAPLPNSYAVALIPNVIVSGNSAFKDAIKVELGHQGIGLIW